MCRVYTLTPPRAHTGTYTHTRTHTYDLFFNHLLLIIIIIIIIIIYIRYYFYILHLQYMSWKGDAFNLIVLWKLTIKGILFYSTHTRARAHAHAHTRTHTHTQNHRMLSVKRIARPFIYSGLFILGVF